MVGDLKYGRTVHSLLQAMSEFENPIFHFISPKVLEMPRQYKLHLVEKCYSSISNTENSLILLAKADIIYMTRVQRERFSDPIEYEKVKNAYILRNAMLKNTKRNVKIFIRFHRLMKLIRC